MVEINIGSEKWLAQVKEDIVEPDIRIIDPIIIYGMTEVVLI
ncbi:MAG: hypothetical protein Ct9H300mP3_01210 [Gammaproteobacteria bacterium]|nr:MAG: hypothetical protein Ct9H300mP3_01210 [Gammaproteobacteria bacterium]